MRQPPPNPSAPPRPLAWFVCLAATLPPACSGDVTVDGSSASAGSSTATTVDPDTGVVPTTSGSDADASTSAGGQTMGGTTTDTTGGVAPECICTPGDPGGCEQGSLLVCDDDCQGATPQPCPAGQACIGDGCFPQVCAPGEVVCADEVTTQTCDAQGAGYEPPVACAVGEVCSFGACSSLCAEAEATPSSVGCSFLANRMDNANNEQPDSLVVGNTSETLTAEVQLYFVPNGSNTESPEGPPAMLPPGETLVFHLTNEPLIKVSALRRGGVYRVQSTIPIVAYQHSPLGAQATNDASMLLPEHALRQHYIIASYPDSVPAEDHPSYFDVIATVDGTTVTWTPPVATYAGLDVDPVAPGGTGEVTLDRFDTLQIRANTYEDLSGTIVHADGPIWVVGASNCALVPTGIFFCDHLEEQMLPLEYWGKRYVGAHSPVRGSEKHYWRIYGGEDGTVVTADPPVPGTPVAVDKGEWKELALANGTSTIFESDRPFLAVQYLAGQDADAGYGDPAMYQMIPTEQFLDRYAFVTGIDYTTHYAQILRVKGNPDVQIDGETVTGYYTVGDYEVADFEISEGAHLAASDAPFGVINIGYTPVTSYAYPGGLRLTTINPQ